MQHVCLWTRNLGHWIEYFSILSHRAVICRRKWSMQESDASKSVFICQRKCSFLSQLIETLLLKWKYLPLILHLLTYSCVSLSLFPPVRYLLKNSVSPDLCNEDGLTALHQVTPFDCVSTLLSVSLLYGLFPPLEPSITNRCLNFW